MHGAEQHGKVGGCRARIRWRSDESQEKAQNATGAVDWLGPNKPGRTDAAGNGRSSTRRKANGEEAVIWPFNIVVRRLARSAHGGREDEHRSQAAEGFSNINGGTTVVWGD